MLAHEVGGLPDALEVQPGYWLVGPGGGIEIGIDEISLYNHGSRVPGSGDGRMQIVVRYPYSNREVFKARKGQLDEKAVKKAAAAATDLVEKREWEMRLHVPAVREAYAAGREYIRQLSDDERGDLWSSYEAWLDVQGVRGNHPWRDPFDRAWERSLGLLTELVEQLRRDGYKTPDLTVRDKFSDGLKHELLHWATATGHHVVKVGD